MNVSKVLKEDLTQTQIGTPFYLSPEIWLRKKYSQKCDIFSLGCLIYELAKLEHPYEARSSSELERKVINNPIPHIPSDYSDELNFIIRKCLTKNPNKRPSATQLFDHPIIKSKAEAFRKNVINESLK